MLRGEVGEQAARHQRFPRRGEAFDFVELHRHDLGQRIFQGDTTRVLLHEHPRDRTAVERFQRVRLEGRIDPARGFEQTVEPVVLRPDSREFRQVGADFVAFARVLVAGEALRALREEERFAALGVAGEREDRFGSRVLPELSFPFLRGEVALEQIARRPGREFLRGVENGRGLVAIATR